jgi:hypothetical protein
LISNVVTAEESRMKEMKIKARNKAKDESWIGFLPGVDDESAGP